ncbi:hypothetical protein TNCV_2805771 [Trichonephila clavipes]|nr:hypothetical protein TNCV_2805771 [Trichonephila clavipes]
MTVVYRHQANRTERVNRDLMLMIANYDNEQHDMGPILTKYDETEIGTGSSDNGSLRDESSGFDRVQRRSNDSREMKRIRTDQREDDTTREDQFGSRKGRERNDSPYIEERTRSSKKNARRGGNQQRQD